MRFDQVQNRPQSLEAVYPPPNVIGGLGLTGVPVSITLWIYFESGDIVVRGKTWSV